MIKKIIIYAICLTLAYSIAETLSLGIAWSVVIGCWFGIIGTSVIMTLDKTEK